VERYFVEAGEGGQTLHVVRHHRVIIAQHRTELGDLREATLHRALVAVVAQ
jgi:hypothetical protein